MHCIDLFSCKSCKCVQYFTLLNRSAAGLCLNPLVELTAFPQTAFSWLQGAGPRKEKLGEGRKEETERGGGERRMDGWKKSGEVMDGEGG